MQINHTEYPAMLKLKNDDTLRFIILDCQRALKAMPDNPKAGYYADEINYCAMELHVRSRKAS